MTSSFQWSLPPEAPFPRNAAARTTSTVLLLADSRATRIGAPSALLHKQSFGANAAMGAVCTPRGLAEGAHGYIGS